MYKAFDLVHIKSIFFCFSSQQQDFSSACILGVCNNFLLCLALRVLWVRYHNNSSIFPVYCHRFHDSTTNHTQSLCQVRVQLVICYSVSLLPPQFFSWLTCSQIELKKKNEVTTLHHWLKHFNSFHMPQIKKKIYPRNGFQKSTSLGFIQEYHHL